MLSFTKYVIIANKSYKMYVKIRNVKREYKSVSNFNIPIAPLSNFGYITRHNTTININSNIITVGKLVTRFEKNSKKTFNANIINDIAAIRDSLIMVLRVLDL